MTPTHGQKVRKLRVERSDARRSASSKARSITRRAQRANKKRMFR